MGKRFEKTLHQRDMKIYVDTKIYIQCLQLFYNTIA